MSSVRTRKPAERSQEGRARMNLGVNRGVNQRVNPRLNPRVNQRLNLRVNPRCFDYVKAFTSCQTA